jgi:hypothetical protein
MAYESAPVPLPAGSLEPPRRFPPTAVGTMQPPPRRPRRSRYPTGPWLVRRVALRGLALICLLGSAAVLWPLSWHSSVGAGLMSLSVHVAHRSLLPQRGSRVVGLSESSRDVTGESRVRSA